MNPTLKVYGYHGTNTESAALIMRRGFNISDNDYDWLRTGVYFFQDAPVRAMEWAKYRYPQNPAVIRSLIRLENCIDLFDIGWFPLVRNLYNSFMEEYRKSDKPLPTQNPERSKAHRLDCAFFNYIVDILGKNGENINIIRGIFIEGERIFPTSAIFDLSHVQLAIRNTAIIEESHILTIKGVI